MLSLNSEKVAERERSLAEPRYGVSLIAGRPFCRPVVEAIRQLQLSLDLIVPAGFIFPDPNNAHSTVLRGQSSLLPFEVPKLLLSAVADALEGCPPVTLAWPRICLDSDGAIRAYASPHIWPFATTEKGDLAARVLSSTLALRISVQSRLWVTIGSARARAWNEKMLKQIRELLTDSVIPETIVRSLQLVYYWDLLLSRADTLCVYELR